MDGFRSALERIGFNAPTQQFMIDNDFTNISSLATVSDTDVKELIKHIE